MGAAASVGGQWNQSDIDRIRSVLREIDDDKLTSLEEAKRQISRLRRILQERVEKREEEAHNGSITFSEFLAATLDKTKYLEGCRLTAVFQKLDTDHDGKISVSDLKDALGTWYSVSEIESMIGDVQSDDDNGGTVDFHQFVEAMYDGTGDYMRPYKTRALSMCVSSG